MKVGPKWTVSQILAVLKVSEYIALNCIVPGLTFGPYTSILADLAELDIRPKVDGQSNLGGGDWNNFEIVFLS